MTNRMWGGRFSSGPGEIMAEINASIDFDRRFFAQDIAGSIAHCEMLASTGVISEDDSREIRRGLELIQTEIDRGEFNFSRALEDIHMNIEARLADLIGEPAGRLHTARSRNDQVATDFRLYLRDVIDMLTVQISDLQENLISKASIHAEAIMPGFTHMQSAQPVTFGHHCLAYVEMLERDKSRFEDARKRLNECPLGCAALAGTSFPIDRKMTAKTLGFSGPSRNSLDAVSDRDFVLETLAAASICATHLSRLADEIVFWCSKQFQFVSLSDQFSSGSSIMPQKRNPDAAELVRAKVGRIMGAFSALTIVMKGLPLAYSKDMQEDKEPAFDALDNLSLALAAMAGMVKDLTPNVENMHTAASAGFSTATDLADWLVRVLGLPFREAHHVTGEIVAMAEARSCELEELTLEDMRSAHPDITQDVFSVLGVENSVNSRTSFGGTAPENVKAQVKFWKERLGNG